MAAIDSAFDMLAPDSGTNIVSNVLSIGVVYVVFRMLLQKEGMIENEGAFASYFGVSFLSGLGVLAGLVLLIVPGLYLMARWSLASAMVVAQGLKATDAMRASWQATQGFVWKVVLLYLLCVGVFFAILLLLGGSAGYFAASAGGAFEDIDTSLPFVVLLNVAVNLGVVGSAYLSVALFDHIVGRDRTVQGIFA